MRILFIAPLPPPITGQSLAVKVFKDFIKADHEVEVVNLVKNTFNNGFSSLNRVVEILRIFKDVWIKSKKADKIYFTISESVAGNLKDILIYIICYKKLSSTYVHLHGGAGMRIIMNNKNWLTKLNIFFLRKIASIIVLGESLLNIYDGITPEKVHAVKNFAENYLFIENHNLIKKFDSLEPLNMLFLSNLIPGKGHVELLSAFKQLDEKFKQMIRIKYAGRFETEFQKISFLEEIKDIQQISYEGIVNGDIKRNLFHQAHVFFLPTYYPFEGQPISILEAYASGCVVVTTNHSGIKDIFVEGINGFEVEKKSANSLKLAIERAIDQRDGLSKIASKNVEIAEKSYRPIIYNEELKYVLQI